MMSAISEAWTIMNKHMEMKYDDIGNVFEKWSSEGELVSSLPLVSKSILTALEKHILSQNWGRYMRAERQERESCPW